LALDEPKDGDQEVQSGDLTFLMNGREARNFLAMGITVDFSAWPDGGCWQVSPNMGFGFGAC